MRPGLGNAGIEITRILGKGALVQTPRSSIAFRSIFEKHQRPLVKQLPRLDVSGLPMGQSGGFSLVQRNPCFGDYVACDILLNRKDVF